MGIGIHCCKNCVPPKRHDSCHATCEEYLKEKAQFEEDKKKVKENESPKITAYDLNELAYADYKRHKRKRRN